MTNISVEKTDLADEYYAKANFLDNVQAMELAIKKLFYILDQPSPQFSSEDAFNLVLDYVNLYKRVWYSTITNIVFTHCDNYYSKSSPRIKQGDPLGTIQSNLDALVKYSECLYADATSGKCSENSQEKTASIMNARWAIFKIRDHIIQTTQQYSILKQFEAEYDLKLKELINYQKNLTKEMNAQMLAMVGMFTALAFLIFGSISSLDGVFENLELHLFKVLSIGLLWGICISNMIFVFLYCVGQMSGLNFKANNDCKASIFLRYPIVWWTNLTLISLLMITIWIYFIQQTSIGENLYLFVNLHPLATLIIGSVTLLLVIVIGTRILIKKTVSSQKTASPKIKYNRK